MMSEDGKLIVQIILCVHYVMDAEITILPG